MIHIYKSIMITLLLALVPFMGISVAKKKAQQQSDRQYWCSLAYKMAQPVLEIWLRASCKRTCYRFLRKQPFRKTARWAMFSHRRKSHPGTDRRCQFSGKLRCGSDASHRL